jgi:hypothetical protein
MRALSFIFCFFCALPTFLVGCADSDDFLWKRPPPQTMETDGTIETVTGDGDTYYEEQRDDGDWYYGALQQKH